MKGLHLIITLLVHGKVAALKSVDGEMMKSDLLHVAIKMTGKRTITVYFNLDLTFVVLEQEMCRCK